MSQTSKKRQPSRARAGQRSGPIANLFLRIDFAEGSRLGPGKVALLEAIQRCGSISAAARDQAMGYRNAWLLVDSLNSMFAELVVSTQPGRRKGGSEVTAFGMQVIHTFRRMEHASRAAIHEDLAQLQRKLK
jgi:molybdate transport system regulatory protein